MSWFKITVLYTDPKYRSTPPMIMFASRDTKEAAIAYAASVVDNLLATNGFKGTAYKMEAFPISLAEMREHIERSKSDRAKLVN